MAGQEDVALSRAAKQLVQTTLVIWFPQSDWFRNGRAAMRCKGVEGGSGGGGHQEGLSVSKWPKGTIQTSN